MADNEDLKFSVSIDDKELLKQLDDVQKRAKAALTFEFNDKGLKKTQDKLANGLEDVEKFRIELNRLANTRVESPAATRLREEIEHLNSELEKTAKRIKDLKNKGYKEDSGYMQNALQAQREQQLARRPLVASLASLQKRNVDTVSYRETQAYQEQLTLLKEKQAVLRGNLIPLEKAHSIQLETSDSVRESAAAERAFEQSLQESYERLSQLEAESRKLYDTLWEMRIKDFGAAVPTPGESKEYDEINEKYHALKVEIHGLEDTILDQRVAWEASRAEIEKVQEVEQQATQSAQEHANAQKEAEQAVADAFKQLNPADVEDYVNRVRYAYMTLQEMKSGEGFSAQEVIDIRKLASGAAELTAKYEALKDVYLQFFHAVKANKENLSPSSLQAYLNTLSAVGQELNSVNAALAYVTNVTKESTLSDEEKARAIEALTEKATEAKLAIEQLYQAQADEGVTQERSAEIAQLEGSLAQLNLRIKELGGGIIHVEIPDAAKVENTLLGMIVRLRELKVEQGKLEKLQSPTLAQAQQYEKNKQEIEKLTLAIKEWGKAADDTANSNENLNQTAGPASDSVERTSRAAKAWKLTATGLKDVMKLFSKYSKSAEKAHNEFSRSLRRGLSNLTKYVFGFRSLFFLIRKLRSGIKEGIKNLVQYDSANNETNKKMTELMTSLLFLKNAWGAAFAPILNVVLPILSALLDMIAAVGNAIAMFIGRLTGQEVVIQAVRAATNDYADSLRNAGGGASRASKEAKKLHDRLAAFDDLNVLGKDDDTDPNKSGGGGGGGNVDMPSINDMFTRAVAENSLADMIRDAWITDGDMSEVGALFGDFIEGALERIPWDSIQSTAERIGFGAGTFLTGLFGDPSTFEAIGHTIAEGLNTVTLAIHGFFEGYDAGSFASSAAAAIVTFFRDTDWATMGENFSSYASTIMTEISTFFDDLDIESIADAWESFWTSIDWEAVAVGFNDLSISIVDLTARVLQAQGAGVTDWIWDLFHANEGNHLGLMGMGILRLGEYCSYAVEWLVNLARSLHEIQVAVYMYIGVAVVSILEGAWQFISGLVTSLFTLIGSFIAWLAGNVTNAIQHFVTTAKDLVRYLKDQVIAYVNAVKSNWNMFKSAVASGIRYISEQISTYLELAGNAFWNWYDVLSSVWSSISSLFTSGANGALGVLESFVNGMIGGINAIINAFNSLDIDIPSGAQTFLSALTSTSVPSSISFNIQPLPTVSLPRLAQGAVIPANHEFAAILGDQTHGTNIEAPLDTIKQAVAEELNTQIAQMMYGFQSVVDAINNKNLNVNIGDREIGQANARYTNRQNVIRGVRPVV